MTTGTVKFFNEDKGFGFIKDNDSDTESFIHVTNLGGITIREGDQVTYDVVPSKNKEGKLDAINVKMLDEGDVKMAA